MKTRNRVFVKLYKMTDYSKKAPAFAVNKKAGIVGQKSASNKWGISRESITRRLGIPKYSLRNGSSRKGEVHLGPPKMILLQRSTLEGSAEGKS